MSTERTFERTKVTCDTLAAVRLNCRREHSRIDGEVCGALGRRPADTTIDLVA